VSTLVPYRPRKVAAAEAAFTSTVRGKNRVLSLNLGGAPCEIALLAPGPARNGSALKFTDGAAAAWVRLADWNGLPSISELAAGAFDALPVEMQAVVAEVALAPMLDALGNATGAAWRIADVGAWPTEFAHAVGFELRDPSGARRRGDLALDASASAIFTDLIRRAPTAPGRDLGAAPVPVRLQIGETRVSRADLAGLRAGDILLVERLFVPPKDGEQPGKSALAVVGAGLAFEAAVERGTAALQAPATVPPPADAETARFEIPGVPVTLAAAKGLKAGASLTLGGGTEDVRVVQAGRTVAAGSLVLCAGQLGLRVRADVERRDAVAG